MSLWLPVVLAQLGLTGWLTAPEVAYAQSPAADGERSRQVPSACALAQRHTPQGRLETARKSSAAPTPGQDLIATAFTAVGWGFEYSPATIPPFRAGTASRVSLGSTFGGSWCRIGQPWNQPSTTLVSR